MKRNEIRIDAARCEGHAICFMLAPDVFEVDDDGRGTVIDPQLAHDHEEDARAAFDRCPERAITIAPCT